MYLKECDNYSSYLYECDNYIMCWNECDVLCAQMYIKTITQMNENVNGYSAQLLMRIYTMLTCKIHALQQDIDPFVDEFGYFSRDFNVCFHDTNFMVASSFIYCTVRFYCLHVSSVHVCLFPAMRDRSYADTESMYNITIILCGIFII